MNNIKMNRQYSVRILSVGKNFKRKNIDYLVNKLIRAKFNGELILCGCSGERIKNEKDCKFYVKYIDWASNEELLQEYLRCDTVWCGYFKHTGPSALTAATNWLNKQVVDSRSRKFRQLALVELNFKLTGIIFVKQTLTISTIELI